VPARQRAYGLIIFTNERKGTHKDYNGFYLPPSLLHETLHFIAAFWEAAIGVHSQLAAFAGAIAHLNTQDVHRAIWLCNAR